MEKLHVSKMSQHAELYRTGFAMEYFPCYVNLEKHLHAVDVVLLSFVLKGKGAHYLGHEAYPEAGPSVSVTHYGQVHDIVTNRRGMEIMNIYLNFDRFVMPDMPAALRQVIPQVLPLHPNFYATPGHMTRIEFGPDAPAKSIVLLLYREYKKKEEARSEVLRDYFRIFLVECCRHVMKKGLIIRGNGRAKSYDVMEPIRQYIDMHYTEYLSLAALVKHSGYSGPYLCKLFKEYTGKTIYDYILDKRLQTAMMQLKFADQNISAIAMDSGFTDISFFNKLFKRKLGVTPRDYRKQQAGILNMTR